VLNFELADEFGGTTHLRFDDTNPRAEDAIFVQSMIEDVQWLGYRWERLHYASEYFEHMYDCALVLIRKGLAYVDDCTAEQIRAQRGTLSEPGIDSPYRNRTVEENIALFSAMRAGEFANGAKVLRARIDMRAPNINMRDPVLYRIAHEAHHQTGTQWCIYPMYAFAHPLEDALEGITHSLCTVEFEDQRPFYDWVVRSCEMPHVPKQIEFGRLNVTHTVMSKRKLRAIVQSQEVDGWDDPRLPTLSGMRRRGIPPEAIVSFVKQTGLSKSNGVADIKMLEHIVREQLQLRTPKTMAVLDPLRVIITNYPEGTIEWIEGEYNSDNPSLGSRRVPFGRELFIERDDFLLDPPASFYRLGIGREVRLRHAYFVRCHDVVYDDDGSITALLCTYDPETKSGSGFTGRKVKATIHWVEASHAMPATFALFDHLLDEHADDHDDVRVLPTSRTSTQGYVEHAMADAPIDTRFQLLRHGFFIRDAKVPDQTIYHRIVSLKSSYPK
jgi:glutaminyl-tRNA synthetase